MVATLGETTGACALKSLHQQMQQTVEGQLILEQKPRVNTSTINLEYLRKLPSNTFGHAYAAFLDRYGYNPDERALVKFVEQPELAYVMQRYREVHDFWHVLTGLPTHVLGEIAQKVSIGLDWIGLDWIGLDWIGLESDHNNRTRNNDHTHFSGSNFFKPSFQCVLSVHLWVHYVCRSVNRSL